MKVAIVNDSRMAVEVLRRVLAGLPGFTLLWTASSGDEALRQCATARPDIVLMDLIMPGIDGAETTRRIMQTTPCVILVVTATTVGNRNKVFEAMGYGALDAVNTPTLGPSGDMTGAEPLIQKLRTVSRLVVAARRPSQLPLRVLHTAQMPRRLPIIAIGASTGGPHALAETLKHLPSTLRAAILIAQHVDEEFAPGLATWLQHHCSLPVRIARHGEIITAGGVWIAGTRDHLICNGSTLEYTPNPTDTAYRPSVDALFSSLAQPHRELRIGVLLTGMGRDGARGLRALRDSGALTIAQDAATSVVYGMPKAAAELQAATEILPLASIGPRIHQAILDASTPSRRQLHPQRETDLRQR